MFEDIGVNLARLLSSYWPNFLSGLWGTLQLSALTVFCGTLLGSIIAIGLLSKNKIVHFFLKFYANLLRGTPLLLQLYFFYYFLPEMVPLEISKTTCIILALIVNSSAYVAEIIRSGIQAVDKGQTEAAKSLGMTNTNMMIRIIMPQAIKNILPALGNEFISMIKETSLCTVFFINELMTTSKILQSTLYMTLEPLIIVGMIYFLLTTILTKLVSMLEKRLSVSD